MATEKHLPRVSLFTDYERHCVRILIAGKNGDLGIEAYAEGPTLSIPDPDRGPLRVKAVCELFANGRLKGFFIERKGATPQEDTMVFFPARKGGKPLPTARRVKK